MRFGGNFGKKASPAMDDVVDGDRSSVRTLGGALSYRPSKTIGLILR